jgi:nucleotide-binding universal stress UspA family protein
LVFIKPYLIEIFKVIPLKTIRKILVPLDGSMHSKKALELAIKLSKQGTSITGFHTIILPAISDRKIKEQYQRLANKIIVEAAKIAKKDGIPFYWKLRLNGYAGKEIVKFAQEGKFDLIVMGSKGPNPVAEMFLGSVANYVLNKSKVPVLIVK